MEQVAPPVSTEDGGYNVVTPDTVSLAKLELLRGSEALLNLLKNPHLRQMMLALDSSSDPSELIERAMREPIFVEFADVCLEIVEDTSPQ